MNPHLSHIDKSIVGILILPEKLMQIQAMGIWICFPNVVKNIDVTLEYYKQILRIILEEGYLGCAYYIFKYIGVVSNI
jgi:hypothetical protein